MYLSTRARLSFIVMFNSKLEIIFSNLDLVTRDKISRGHWCFFTYLGRNISVTGDGSEYTAISATIWESQVMLLTVYRFYHNVWIINFILHR